jgi:hypothetical protein
MPDFFTGPASTGTYAPGSGPDTNAAGILAVGGVLATLVRLGRVGGAVQVTGDSFPTAGAGLELQFSGLQGNIQSFDRAGAAFRALTIISNDLRLDGGANGARIVSNVGFYNGVPAAKQVVAGSRAANAALASLLTALAAIGLVTDNSVV